MAKPPRSMALKPASAPESLPIGVRAPATMTEPGMENLRNGLGSSRRSAGPGHSTGVPRGLARAGGTPRAGAAAQGGKSARRVGCATMHAFRDAILAGASGEELAALALPDSYRAAFVRRD